MMNQKREDVEASLKLIAILLVLKELVEMGETEAKLT